MAGRFSVEATFRARDRLTRPVRRMGSRLDRFQDRAERGFRRMSATMGRLRTGVLALGVGIAGASLAAARGLQDVAETGMDFDTAITAAAAKFPGQIRRGTEAFSQLEQAAQRVGGTTEFTASQSASALDFLAMAGFSAEQAVGALPGVVDLATAAQMELAEATDIASDTLGAFGLMSEDAAQLGTNLTRVNDVLARTSTSSNTTVAQMFEAIRTGGSTARAAGTSIETFSSMLGQLAGSGVKGAEAGTALRNVFLRLQNPTGAAARHLRRLRIETADGEGNFRDIVDIMGDFEQRLEGMGNADRGAILSEVFGARSVNAVNILLEGGAERLGEYRTSLEGASGAAAEMASAMRDTAGGDMASLNSAVEGLKLEIWGLVRGPMRDVVRGVTEWVRAHQGSLEGTLRRTVAFIQEYSTELGAIAIAVGVVLGIVVVGFTLMAALIIAGAAVMVGTLAVISGVVWGIITIVIQGILWIGDLASGVADTVAAFVQGIWGDVESFGRAVMEFVVGLFVVLRDAVRPYLAPVLDLIRAAASWAREAWAPVGAFFGELWSGISAGGSSAWSGLMSGAAAVADRIREVFEPIRMFFAELWGGIATGFGEALGWAVDGVSSLVDDIRGQGRAELAGGDAGSPQVVTPSERVTRSISESRSTDSAEVTVRADQGTSAEVTRRPRGGTRLVMARSGAF